MDKNNRKDRDNQKDKSIQDKEIESLDDKELDRVSGGGRIDDGFFMGGLDD